MFIFENLWNYIVDNATDDPAYAMLSVLMYYIEYSITEKQFENMFKVLSQEQQAAILQEVDIYSALDFWKDDEELRREAIYSLDIVEVSKQQLQAMFNILTAEQQDEFIKLVRSGTTGIL